jgi:hypothetical protein
MVNFDRRIFAFSSRIKEFGSVSLRALSPKVSAFTSSSPKLKAIAAGGALAVVAGVAAPIAVTQAGSPASAQSAAQTAGAGTHDSSITTDVSNNSNAPSSNELHPDGIQGSQSDFPLSPDQMKNAQQIVEAGKSMGLPPRAWVIALATSMQETKLHNYGDLGNSNDHDSLGLFQQRPSSGWGSPKQLENPTYAAKAFYKALTQVHGWDKMPLTDAAQAVQVSAFGDRYAQWEAHAGDVVDGFYGHGPLAHTAHKAK